MEDVTGVTYNSQDLKAFLAGGIEVDDEAVVDSWRPGGAVYPSQKLTGQSTCADIDLAFKYDGTATGPAVKCARGTSATLTLTFATGISLTGTFVVKKWAFSVPEEGLDVLTVTLAPDGAVTWDLAE